jgi:hypothetical protein
MTSCGSWPLSLLPLISYGYVWVFWLLASASLGEWVRPSIHDPKDFLYGIPLYLHMALWLSSFAVAPLVVALDYRAGSPVRTIAYGISLVLAVVLFRTDFLQVTTWITD